ncbi:hypothetical protein B0H16DRAFT_1734704 [Mycena metata]|uniref:F-box domain-containing protein n=1 Tax=Mycena metata TaxID=1033252 RepID=A0AAD7HTZ9_9AGAR|nr:hypothetical protein B0H16DRAFT_1734704 [Mycena metata]
MPSYLSEAPPDVVFSIFIYCDIASVVSVGQTCRYLHDLSLHQSVWLALVKDLRQRFILPPMIPDLEGARTMDLITLVKRTLTGPETWNPTSSGFAPQVSQRITLHPTIHLGAGILSWENEAKLSPSGHYVLFNNWQTLECWDVVADTLIWKHVSNLDRAGVLLFAMDEPVDGDTLIIVICERTRSLERKKQVFFYIEIIELDLRSGAHTSLLQLRCPDTSYDNPFADPAILGNVAVVALSAYADVFLVLDWKSQSAFAVEASGTHCGILMEIVPAHLILKTRDVRDRTGSGDLYLIDIEATLRSHGAPVDLHAGAPFHPVTLDDLPKILTQSIMPSVEGSPRTSHQLSVCRSPLHTDIYRIWVFHSHTDAVLCSYDLSLRPATAPSWIERTRAPARHVFYHHRIAYSGHTEFFERIEGRPGVVSQIAPPVLTPTRGELDLPGDCADPIDVSAYFGALTFATNSEVIILYFK